MLQQDLAKQPGQRKAHNIILVNPDVVATGNLGCITQIVNYLDVPVLHTVELLDWASGGQKPSSLY